jgi:hypothetical protein
LCAEAKAEGRRHYNNTCCRSPIHRLRCSCRL